MNTDSLSPEAQEVLTLLKLNHNVILVGPPAVGKSFLMAEIRNYFKGSSLNTSRYDSEDGNPFPVRIENMLSPEKRNRQVFSTTFHQGSKYQSFVSGLSPAVSDHMNFEVVTGPFYESVMHAKEPDSTSLLEIDELNRGPAVAVFGDLITAIESDKRTLPDNSSGLMSYPIKILHVDGKYRSEVIPYHLFILCSMNLADSAVDPIDVAFLRRFSLYRLYPDLQKIKNTLDITSLNYLVPFDGTDMNVLLNSLVKAIEKINEVIEIVKGIDYQIGHGVVLGVIRTKPTSMTVAQNLISIVWRKIFTHLTEIFHNEDETLSLLLNASSELSPFSYNEIQYGNGLYTKLNMKPVNSVNDYYNLFRSIAEGNDE